MSEEVLLARRFRRKVLNAWYGMIRRCTDRRCKDFKLYGGRGITVARSLMTFEGFLAEVGMPPTLKHSLDRIDFAESYRPGNLRWADWRTQNTNKRDTVRYHFNGKSQTLSAWAEELGIKYHTLNARIKINGWPLEEALSVGVVPFGLTRECLLKRTG